mmetsp:Transcript_105690/g.305582  ORF Transcript_105690/g.305582 Transcript_105690/m.305582 type:complete len:244 (+) Transcript_105690:1112-1843(+)
MLSQHHGKRALRVAAQIRAEFSGHQRTRTQPGRATRALDQGSYPRAYGLRSAGRNNQRASALGMMRVFRNWLRAVGYAGLVGLWHTRTCSTPFRLEMKNRSMRPLVVVPHRRITGSPFGSMQKRRRGDGLRRRREMASGARRSLGDVHLVAPPWPGRPTINGHGMIALATSSTRCRGRAAVQRKLEPSRDGPSVRPCDRHAGGAAIKRRHQSSSIIIIMPAAPKACLLQRAACSEPLAASHLR